MEYHEIPALIKGHKERITRCEDILRECSQFGVVSENYFGFSLQIGERYTKTNLQERIKICNMLIEDSKKAMVELEKPHNRMLEVSADFK